MNEIVDNDNQVKEAPQAEAMPGGHHGGKHHCHEHHHHHHHEKHCHERDRGQAVLTIRSHSGISGDMLLTGLAALAMKDMEPDSAQGKEYLNDLAAAIMPELSGCLTLQKHSVAGICGWQAQVDLPHAHEHRGIGEIKAIIDKSGLAAEAKKRAGLCFELIAACEAKAHGIDIEDAHFHEVGALDSILDICGACELYTRIGEPELICGSLPVADGQIDCAHGILPAPAPAVLCLLRDIPLRPFAGDAQAGELLTPTGVALLRALDAKFGSWPEFSISDSVIVYGQKEFPGAPNGLIFALGK